MFPHLAKFPDLSLFVSAAFFEGSNSLTALRSKDTACMSRNSSDSLFSEARQLRANSLSQCGVLFWDLSETFRQNVPPQKGERLTSLKWTVEMELVKSHGQNRGKQLVDWTDTKYIYVCLILKLETKSDSEEKSSFLSNVKFHGDSDAVISNPAVLKST